MRKAKNLTIIMKKFNEYKQLNLPQLSREVLEQWEDEHLFEKSVTTREGHPRFLFFEGPPSANGMPGIHHVMARTIKDTFCRFKTMQGYQVRRKAGWDTHGLPVELGVEKMLGITKEDIGKKISVDEYNAACRREVMKYTREWTNLTKQMGYWVDLDNPYITYDNKYIETLWYLLKELYQKGYLYKGYTIQPYSPAAGTGLSSHELNQPGCYRDVKDLTCTARFKVKNTDRFADRIQNTDLYIIAWTTTPWTLPSNTALCVGPKIDYVEVETPAGDHVILAEARLDAYRKELCGADEEGKPLEPKIVARYKGADLVGLKYEPLFPWVNPGEGAFRVIPGDYVTTEDGTGIVHIAPTFGADDKKVADAAGVPGLYMQTKNNGLRPMVDFTGKYWNVEDLDEEWYQASVNDELYRRYAGCWVKNAYDPQFTVDGKYDEAAAAKAESLDLHLCLEMKADGRLLRSEKHVHTYPHCWRTDKPVLYYPLDSWFIRSTKAKDEMIALNNTINWQPESTGTGRFGQWLNNLNDWNLSRSRYWGTPLPIWCTEDGSEETCIGSITELFAEIDKSVKAGFMTANPWPNHKPGDYSKENYDLSVIDLHRPYVDSIILVSPSGKPMKRELDLIDVWFDSGAMPYAQNHYPFENADLPRTADFISEGVDQTRGWFFTLHAIHTMIEGTVAYKNVISNGLVLDKNGNKMSKRLGNAVDPFKTLGDEGPDATRWYMITNSQPWDNLKFDPAGVTEVRRKLFGTLYNTYSFFALYANIDGFDYSQPDVPYAQRPEIDRWILSELNTLVKTVDEAFADYEPTRAGRAIDTFVDAFLSNWYVRLSRRRFWKGQMSDDKVSAYQTLYTCLETLGRIMAPIAPFFCERLFQDLNRVTRKHNAASVHHLPFPEVHEEMRDSALEERMQLAQQICSMGLSLRKKSNLRVRQPLQKIVIPVRDEAMQVQVEKVQHLICSELNVKGIEFLSPDNDLLVKKIKPNFKTLGPRYGKIMKTLGTVIMAFDQAQINAIEAQGRCVLDIEGQTVEVLLSDVEIVTQDIPGWVVANEGNLTVALDITVTPELRDEGVARELVNRIQNIRKEGFDVTDRIVIRLQSGAWDDAVRRHLEYICSETLCTSLTVVDTVAGGATIEIVEGQPAQISITKA